MQLLPRNPWLALPVAWLIFSVIGRAVKAGLSRLRPGPPWRAQAVLKGAILAFALIAAAIEGVRLAELGFRSPAQELWGRAILGGFALGASTTLVMLAARATGMRAVIGGFSFGAMVLWIWIGSSVAEEVFCRGWFQASTDPSAILPSAILFGCLHLVLLFAGVDVRSTVVVVASTTLLGGIAAWARAESGSLYPAIAAHVAFNVGGVAAGGVYAITFRAVTGKLPFGAPPNASDGVDAVRTASTPSDLRG